MVMPRTGIVVPTLGTRPDYLRQALHSIREAGNSYICIVCPNTIDLKTLQDEGLFDSRVDDPKSGLAAAINAGLRTFSSEIVFMSWLGDDDLLEPGSVTELESIFDTQPVDFIWGQCRYINAENEQIWVNKSGKWAGFLMRLGPNLVPQPGSLFSRRAFQALNGLDTQYAWAFDQDFFTRLLREYKGLFVPKTLASFRWHQGSLSAGAREGSVMESSIIRLRYMPRGIRLVARAWEPLVRRVIMVAGSRMNSKTPIQR